MQELDNHAPAAQRSASELTLRGPTVPHLTKDLRKLSEAWAWVYAFLSISLQNLVDCYHKDGPLSYSKALNQGIRHFRCQSPRRQVTQASFLFQR